jgi:hypothetical protein
MTFFDTIINKQYIPLYFYNLNYNELMDIMKLIELETLKNIISNRKKLLYINFSPGEEDINNMKNEFNNYKITFDKIKKDMMFLSNAIVDYCFSRIPKYVLYNIYIKLTFDM